MIKLAARPLAATVAAASALAVSAAPATAATAPRSTVPAAVRTAVDQSTRIMNRINNARLPGLTQTYLAFQAAVSPQVCSVPQARVRLAAAISVVAGATRTDILAAEREDTKLYVLTRKLKGKDKAQLTHDLDAIGTDYDHVLDEAHVLMLVAASITKGDCTDAKFDLTRVGRYVKQAADRLDLGVLKLTIDFG